MVRKRPAFLLLIPLLLVAVVPTAMAQEKKPEPPFAAPVPAGDPATFGAKIQRTMTRLATSTPEKRNHVRVLFYGQSVTRNPWWENVADDLRKRFPHADLEIENRAIGGYGAPTLINTAEFDVYPWYPDLVIFHVWGGVESGHQETLVRSMRERTTAEVLFWTSNLRWPSTVPPDGDPQHPDVLTKDGEDQAIADLYFRLGDELHCEVADVRTGMQDYLKTHNLVVKDTLNDTVHPNQLGNFLIGELVKPHLRHDPAFSDETWKDLVIDIPVDDPRVKRGEDGSLTLEFDGNRVDVVAATGADGGKANVLLDGKAPSAFPELYYHTRPSPTPVAGRPAINRIDHESPLQVETWTARILEHDLDTDKLRYEVIGSKTGPDGIGEHHLRFVSNSGRVVIDPKMWMVNWSLRYKNQALPEDYQVTWETKPLFVDTWQAPKKSDIDPTRERTRITTLVQGVANDRHRIKLVPEKAGEPLPVEAFRVYRPPLK